MMAVSADFVCMMMVPFRFMMIHGRQRLACPHEFGTFAIDRFRLRFRNRWAGALVPRGRSPEL